MKWLIAIVLVVGFTCAASADEAFDNQVKAFAAKTATIKTRASCPNCGIDGCPCSLGGQCPGYSCPTYSKRATMEWATFSGQLFLYRGDQCIGAVDSTGAFRLWDGSQFSDQPSKPPIALPRQEQTMVVQSTPVCRS